jgi:hypothetical protein
MNKRHSYVRGFRRTARPHLWPLTVCQARTSAGTPGRNEASPGSSGVGGGKNLLPLCAALACWPPLLLLFAALSPGTALPPAQPGCTPELVVLTLLLLLLVAALTLTEATW